MSIQATLQLPLSDTLLTSSRVMGSMDKFTIYAGSFPGAYSEQTRQMQCENSLKKEVYRLPVMSVHI